MSELERTSETKATERARPDEKALPQWLMNSLRPVIRYFSKLFWGLEHKGVENIPQHTGLIVASNHQSYGDPFWLSIPIRGSIRYLAWSEAFSWPLVGTIIRRLGAWPLQIEGSDPSAIRRSLSWLRNNNVIMIFPEGGRGLPDGSMRHLKGGAVRIALEAGVPILPATIRGANLVWPTDKALPRLGKVEIIYHPVFNVEQRPGEEARACARRETERLAEIIGSSL